MLAVAPRFDEATEYSFKWIKRLLDELGCEYEALFEEDATREKFEEAVARHDVVVFYDHGDREGLCAQGGLTYVIDKENDHLLKGKVVYTMACLWCSDGGIDAWKKGAKVVWGYVREFAFTVEDEELFMECSNYGLIVKHRENVAWEEAYRRTIHKFNEAIAKARDGWSKVWLRYDRDALVCYTEDNPPRTSTCMFRRALIKLLGPRIAWKIRFRHLLAAVIYAAIALAGLMATMV